MLPEDNKNEERGTVRDVGSRLRGHMFLEIFLVSYNGMPICRLSGTVAAAGVVVPQPSAYVAGTTLLKEVEETREVIT